MKRVSMVLLMAMIVLWSGAALLSVFPAAAQSASPTHTSQYSTYTVRRGDTLTQIAIRFKTTTAKLIALNKLTNPGVLSIGQVLKVPLLPSTPTSAIATEPMPTADQPTVVPVETLTPTIETTPSTYAPTMEVATVPPTVDAALVTTATPDPGVVPTVESTLEAVLAASVTPIVPASQTAPAPDATALVPTVEVIPVEATSGPTLAPTTEPIVERTVEPTTAPTIASTPEPTALPTEIPPTVAPTLSPTPTSTATPNPSPAFAFGLSVQAQGEASLFAAHELGVTWIRYQANWRDLEAVKGQPNFTALDLEVQGAFALSLKVLLTLTTAPDWARNSINEDGPPVNFADFDTFARLVATRYAGKVQAYEIWYEPNLRRNWNGQPLSAASYVKLLKGAHAAIKAADPAASVISAGLSPTGYSDGKNAIGDREYLAQMYKAGLATVSDGVGAHPFGWGNPPEATCCSAAAGVTAWYDSPTFFFLNTLNDYRQIMISVKDTATPLWVTAFGWGAVEGIADPTTVDPDRFGFVRFVSEAQQAAYLQRALQIGRDSGFVGPMFLFNLDGCQAAPPDPAASAFYLCYYALKRPDGSLRPAYTVFAPTPDPESSVPEPTPEASATP